MKKFLLATLLIVFVLILYLTGNTFLQQSPLQNLPVSQPSLIEVDRERAVRNLQQAIQIPTISHKAAMRDTAAYSDFIRFLQDEYPETFARAETRFVNRFSTMLRLYGTNPGMEPLLLLGHIDVVPVDGRAANWDVPAFSGDTLNGYIYGRGTLDDKGSVIAIMEAIETMLENDVSWQRTIILCFGHDEEVGGEEGAIAMSKILKEEGIRAALILDEGGIIASGLVPGFDRPVGLIGTSEKGFLNLELSINIEGGHSSMPEKESAIDILSGAIYRIRKKSFPYEISTPIEGFMDHIGPELPFFERMVFANRRLFQPIITSIYGKAAPSRALVQTTVVPTIIRAGVKDNVVPTFARANLNLRLLPGWTRDRCITYLEKIIANDRIKISATNEFGYSEASLPSPDNHPHFKQLAATVSSHFGDVLPAPYLVLSATDARHYADISEHIFRFIPFRLVAEDVSRIHGNNERISIESYFEGIYFYQQFISDFCKQNK